LSPGVRERPKPLVDTVEFFNLVLGTNLSKEKADLVAFLRCL